MQPRLQTIPSCESVHLLGREKHQKGVLSPVGAQLTEGNHTGRKWWKCENFRATLTSINRTLSSKPHFTRPHWVVLGHGCGGKICFSDIFGNVQASHNTLFQPKFIISAESWSIILQPTPTPKKERHGKHPKFRSYGGTDDESEDGDTGDTDATGGRHQRRPSSSGSWHRQLSPCSVLSVASSGRLYAEPAQTLIFLDWDETWWHCDGAIKNRR